MKTLLLTEKNIRKLLTVEEVIQAVESAFKSKGLGKAQMPEKVYLFYTKHKGDLRVMPSYLEAQDVSAVKIVNVHPENPTKHDLRTVMAVIILVDPRTGAPLAITGGSGITDLRTGAAGSIAAKHLARKDAQVVGLVGAGAQARTQLMGLISLYKTLEEVRVWSRTEKTRRAYTSEMKAMFDTIERMVPVTMVSDAVEGSATVVHHGLTGELEGDEAINGERLVDPLEGVRPVVLLPQQIHQRGVVLDSVGRKPHDPLFTDVLLQPLDLTSGAPVH